jgi:hypothetical protein
MWLVGRLAPDFKTIAGFPEDNGAAIREVCRQFIELCRRPKLFTRPFTRLVGSSQARIRCGVQALSQRVWSSRRRRVAATSDAPLSMSASALANSKSRRRILVSAIS